MNPLNREHYSTGSVWETTVGYARAVRVGPQVFVAGTTATDAQGKVVAVGDAYGQAVYIFQRIEAALVALGAAASDIVRTRLYVTDIDQWEAIGRAHGEFFATIRPAATMVQVQRLIDPDHLIEIEVDALVSEPLAATKEIT